MVRRVGHGNAALVVGLGVRRAQIGGIGAVVGRTMGRGKQQLSGWQRILIKCYFFVSPLTDVSGSTVAAARLRLHRQWNGSRSSRGHAGAHC